MVGNLFRVLYVLHVYGDLHARVYNTKIRPGLHDRQHILRAPGNRLCGDRHPVLLPRAHRTKVRGSEYVLETVCRRPAIACLPRRLVGRRNGGAGRVRETFARRPLGPAQGVQPGVRPGAGGILQLCRFRYDVPLVHNAVFRKIALGHVAERSAGLAEYTVHGVRGRVDHVGERTSNNAYSYTFHRDVMWHFSINFFRLILLTFRGAWKLYVGGLF